MSRAARLVLRGQVALVAFLALCVALHPGAVLARNEGGVSNYGTRLETVVPYTLALGLCALSQWRAARLLRRGGLRRLLLTLATLNAATLVTTYPYRLDLVLTRLHFAVGATTTLVTGLGAAWLAARITPRRALDVVGALSALVGIALCALAARSALHLLFVGQVLLAAGAAPLMVRATWRAP